MLFSALISTTVVRQVKCVSCTLSADNDGKGSCHDWGQKTGQDEEHSHRAKEASDFDMMIYEDSKISQLFKPYLPWVHTTVCDIHL